MNTPGKKVLDSPSKLRTALERLSGRQLMYRSRLRVFHSQEFLRCTTPRKLANLFLVKLERRMRREHMQGMPFSYFIDPLNICNLRCPLCPTGRREQARPAGRMALADLQRIIDEIAPYAYRVELYNWGEPLLHPDIFDMIEYVSRRRISVGLSTNLNHLDTGMARRLVESGLSQMVVSIDGATQETYAAYRRRGSLAKVLDNLQVLLASRRDARSSTPFIVWRMLVGRHNEHEVETVRNMAYAAGVDSFSTGPLYVNTRDPEQVEQWVPRNAAYSPYTLTEEELVNTWNCHELWESMVINWDGGVAPCCWLHDPQFDFASISAQSVREIWNGPSYVSARRVIGRHKEGPHDVPTICHRCRSHPDYLEY